MRVIFLFFAVLLLITMFTGLVKGTDNTTMTCLGFMFIGCLILWHGHKITDKDETT